MERFTQDLDRLARGERIAPEAFRAILADSEARAQLARLAALRDVLSPPGLASPPGPAAPPPDVPRVADLPVTDVTCEELALSAEGRLTDPAREAAVRQFLRATFPESLPHAAAAPRGGRPFRALFAGGKVAASVAATVGLIAAVAGYAVGAIRGENEARDLRDQFGNLRERYTDLERKFEELTRAGQATPAPKRSLDTSRAEFDRGREYTLRESARPDQLTIQFSPFLGPPYYVGLQVDWGDGSALEEVYHQEYTAVKPLVMHSYHLPGPGGQRRIEARLFYRLSGYAMQKFGFRENVLSKAVPLVLTSKGARVATGRAVDAISASVLSPHEGETLASSQFTLELALQAPRRPAPAEEAPGGDRMIHVLVRPLDGPAKLRRTYTVQPFTQRVSTLLELGDTAEHHFTTWVELPGAAEGAVPARPGADQPGPTRYEVLVVELPVRLVTPQVSKELMDFDNEQLKQDVVRARRVVRFAPGAGRPDRRATQ